MGKLERWTSLAGFVLFTSLGVVAGWCAAPCKTVTRASRDETLLSLNEHLEAANRRREAADGQVERLTRLSSGLQKDFADLVLSHAELRRQVRVTLSRGEID